MYRTPIISRRWRAPRPVTRGVTGLVTALLATLLAGPIGGALAQPAEAPGAPTAAPPTPASTGSPAPTDDDRWHLGAAVATDVPATLGVEVWATAPGRVRLGLKAGAMPSGYVDFINSVATGAGWYTDDTAELIASALDDATVVVVQVGWQPRADWGLYVDAGYGRVALSGAATSGEVLVGALGQRPTRGSADDPYTIDSTLHTLRLDVGWRFDLYEGLYADARLGGLITLASSTTVEPTPSDSPLVTAARASVAEDGRAYLDQTYTDFVHSPLLGLALGWRFF